MAQTRPRQNYHAECEAGINKQIYLELYASYVYQSMVSVLVSLQYMQLSAWISEYNQKHYLWTWRTTVILGMEDTFGKGCLGTSEGNVMVHVHTDARNTHTRTQHVHIHDNILQYFIVHADVELCVGVHRWLLLRLQAWYFNRDDVALPGTHTYFKHKSSEEREHAEKFMLYQNTRGGRIVLQTIKVQQLYIFVTFLINHRSNPRPRICKSNTA